jgi:hypothetical protein
LTKALSSAIIQTDKRKELIIMKQMYYQNRECGNLLTYPEMLKEWAELYDGGDPTNPCGWMEHYTCIGALDI